MANHDDKIAETLDLTPMEPKTGEVVKGYGTIHVLDICFEAGDHQQVTQWKQYHSGICVTQLL